MVMVDYFDGIIVTKFIIGTVLITTALPLNFSNQCRGSSRILIDEALRVSSYGALAVIPILFLIILLD